MSEWISIKDKLPESCKEVLAFVAYSDVPVQCYYFAGRNTWHGSREVRDSMRDGYVNDDRFTQYEQDNITHWMPLPKPPSITN